MSNDGKPVQGWACPVCGKGLAPWASECPSPHIAASYGNSSDWIVDPKNRTRTAG